MRFFTHAPREQTLSKAVIDLVSAGVIQILTLEINLCAAPRFRQPLGEVQRRGTSGIVMEQMIEFWPETPDRAAPRICGLQFFQRMHQRSGTNCPP